MAAALSALPTRRAKRYAGPDDPQAIAKRSAVKRARGDPSARRRDGKKSKEERYPLPPEILAVAAVPEPSQQPWPPRMLVFKGWRDVDDPSERNDRDAPFRDVLKARGWTDGGTPCDPEDINDLEDALQGKIKGYRPPRRCLWISGDDKETRLLLKLLGTDKAGRFCITGFPGGEPACYKSNTTKQLAGQPFFPLTFNLPQQRDAFLAAAKTHRYWVGKPKNNYGGRGLVVSAHPADLADGRGVVQQYIHRPLLVGPYKFHMRVYLLITALQPSVRAYVHNDLTVMFTTLPFTMDPKSLEGNFEPRIHLSNYDINAAPKNGAHFFADKPGVGAGCMWSAPRLETWMRKKRPDLPVDALWRQLQVIGRHCALGIAQYRVVREAEHEEHLCHELFGLDVMMDDDGHCWLMECNNSPGLEYCFSHFPPGTTNPDCEENDAVTWYVIDDRFALLGYDQAKTGDEMNYFRVC